MEQDIKAILSRYPEIKTLHLIRFSDHINHYGLGILAINRQWVSDSFVLDNQELKIRLNKTITEKDKSLLVSLGLTISDIKNLLDRINSELLSRIDCYPEIEDCFITITSSGAFEFNPYGGGEEHNPNSPETFENY